MILALAVVSVELTMISALGALAMAAVSLYLFVTAFTGFCPIYAALGVPPLPLR